MEWHTFDFIPSFFPPRHIPTTLSSPQLLSLPPSPLCTLVCSSSRRAQGLSLRSVGYQLSTCDRPVHQFLCIQTVTRFPRVLNVGHVPPGFLNTLYRNTHPSSGH
ncbi:hypothetical protein D9611_014549 [Ephemerocybe angulata]|uniref:Uncharacterized protein n=1 Tax=Ephemerocybe angulata TaxID=980116 RepID=A0A8H5CAA6_9AGAR|nr:hypothetical protein D9611_014549 [Tulosesus angulatus]